MSKEAKITLTLADAASATLSKVTAAFPRLATVATAAASAISKAYEGVTWTLGKVGSIVGGALSKAFDYAKWGALGLAGALAWASKKGIEAEQSQVRLAGVYRATGGALGLSIEYLKAYAEANERAKGTDAELWQDAASRLMMFGNVHGQVFMTAMKSAEDLSKVMGGDLAGSVEMLGKALEDPENGFMLLRRQGIMFNEEQKRRIKTLAAGGDDQGAQQAMLAVIQAKVGGLSDQMANTTGGHLKRMYQSFEIIAERIGQVFGPTLSRASDAVRQWCETNEDSLATFAQKAAAILNFAGGVTSDLFGSKDSWTKKIGVIYDATVEVLRATLKTAGAMFYSLGQIAVFAVGHALKDTGKMAMELQDVDFDYGSGHSKLSIQQAEARKAGIRQRYNSLDYSKDYEGYISNALGKVPGYWGEAGKGIADSARKNTPDLFASGQARMATLHQQLAAASEAPVEPAKKVLSLSEQYAAALQKQNDLLDAQKQKMQSISDVAKSATEQFATATRVEQAQILNLAKAAQQGRSFGDLGDDQRKMVNGSQILSGIYGKGMTDYTRQQLGQALGKDAVGDGTTAGGLAIKIDASPELRRMFIFDNTGGRHAAASRTLAAAR